MSAPATCGATAAGYLASSGQLPPMEIVIHLTELYFRNIHGQTYNFLHKPTFIPRVKQGKVNKTLLLALCGLTSRYSTHPAIDTSIPYQAGEGFIAAARKSLSEQFDEPTLETVQALIFIVQNDFFKSKSKKAMIYVSLAIRMATTLELHLNSKDSTMPFIEHEERRRTYWSLLALDRLAHSAPHWQLQLRTDTLQIQLPCKDYYYENNISVITETLSGEYPGMPKATNPTTGSNSSKNTTSSPAVRSEKGMYAYIVIVTILWCDINKYVMEGYKNETVPPWKEGSTYHDLETRLQKLIESIPKEYEYSKENLISLDTTNQATALIHLHAQIRISLCSLSRSVYPFNYKVMKFDEQPPKAFLESAARSIMASATSLSSVIGDALTIEDIHVAPFIGFGVFTVSSVHIANSFSSDPAIVQAAKDHLATSLKFLVMMREYFYSVGVWCIILKDRYFQKARRHKLKANTSAMSHFAGKDDETNDNQKAENDEEGSGTATNTLRARELKSESVVSGADGFSRPGTPPVAYAPEELMNIAANKYHNSHPSSGISSPKLGSTSHDEEEDMAGEISKFAAGTNQPSVEKIETKPGDNVDETNDESDLEKSRARTWKRALPKVFDEPLSQQSLSQQQQQQRSATKQILSLFPAAKKLKVTNTDDDGVSKKQTPYSVDNVPVSPSQFTDILTRSAFLHTRSKSSISKGSNNSDMCAEGVTPGTSHTSGDDGDFINISMPGGLNTDGTPATATTTTNHSSTNMKNVLLENSGEWLNSLELLGMAHFADPKVPVPNMSNLTHWFGGKPEAASAGSSGSAASANNNSPKPRVEQPPIPELNFEDDENNDNNNNGDPSSETATETTTGVDDDNNAGLKTPSLLDEIFGQVPRAILSSETSDSPSSLSPSSLLDN